MQEKSFSKILLDIKLDHPYIRLEIESRPCHSRLAAQPKLKKNILSAAKQAARLIKNHATSLLKLHSHKLRVRSEHENNEETFEIHATLSRHKGEI